MLRSDRILQLTVLFVGLAWFAVRSSSAELSAPKELSGVTVKENLGNKIDLDLPFTDERGKKVTLRDYFGDSKPILLTLNYHSCSMLCNLQLNALSESLSGLDWKAGNQFRMLTVSIDPKDTVKMAADKRSYYVRKIGKGDVEWTFLVGAEAHIKKLANAVGFEYKYDAASGQYAHPAVAFFLGTDGRVMRYLYGITLSPQDIKFALLETAEGRIGSPVEKLILSCFQYDAHRGSYAPFAMGIMRLAGIVTVLVLGALIFIAFRRERRRKTPIPIEDAS